MSTTEQVPSSAPDVAIEVGGLRAEYVDSCVTRRVNAREGDVTDAEIGQWTAAATKAWNLYYPALAAFLEPS